MHTTRQHEDASTDAGAYAAGLAGQQAYHAQQAFNAGAPTYDAAHNVIANNANGGAGYFAEAHHTASLNIDANHQDLGTSAERVGSTAFGSPDIVVDGVQFNPKFYESAQQSYQAGAQLVGDDGVRLSTRDGRLWAAPPPRIAGLLEVRNLGLVNLPCTEAPVALVLRLEREAPRFIEQAESVDLLGLALPLIALWPDSPVLALRAEMALRIYGLPLSET